MQIFNLWYQTTDIGTMMSNQPLYQFTQDVHEKSALKYNAKSFEITLTVAV